jgi:hypothetical protein
MSNVAKFFTTKKILIGGLLVAVAFFAIYNYGGIETAKVTSSSQGTLTQPKSNVVNTGTQDEAAPVDSPVITPTPVNSPTAPEAQPETPENTNTPSDQPGIDKVPDDDENSPGASLYHPVTPEYRASVIDQIAQGPRCAIPSYRIQ